MNPVKTFVSSTELFYFIWKDGKRYKKTVVKSWEIYL